MPVNPEKSEAWLHHDVKLYLNNKGQQRSSDTELESAVRDRCHVMVFIEDFGHPILIGLEALQFPTYSEL